MKNRLILVPAVLLAACAGMSGKEGPVAVTTIAATAGNSAAGLVKFSQRGERVLVEATLSGLTPGPHGVHIHEKGDCSAPDGMSAGGHFNPAKVTHGAPDASLHHAGDLGNAVADASGNARLALEIDGVTVAPGEHSVVGRSVIVHASQDDFQTQPTGNAGKRVGCGVITPKT